MLKRIAIANSTPRRAAAIGAFSRSLRALFRGTRPSTVFLLFLALWAGASSVLAAPNLQLQTITAVAREGGSTNIVLRVVSDAAVDADLAVYFDVSLPNGDPVQGVNLARYDSAALGDHVVIPAGAASADITIVPVNNTAVDGHLTLAVTLRDDPAYSLPADIAQKSANVIINDDESLPTLSVSSSLQVMIENNSQVNASQIQFSLSNGPLAYAFDVKYEITGNATRYQFGAPHFGVGDAFSFQTLTIGNDAEQQGDQTLIFTLKESPYYLTGPSSSFTIIIQDDDSSAPSANFLLDQVVQQGDTAIVPVELSSAPSHYPVQIPFIISPGTGAVAGTHYTEPADFELQITSGLRGEIQIPTLAGAPKDGVDKFIVVRMRQPVNARLGQFTLHTVIIAQGNVQPTVSLSAAQSGRQTRLITIGGGDVTVTAAVSDVNGGDTHFYDWRASNNNLQPKTGFSGQTFVFDPAGLAPGYYKARVTVTDSGSPPLSAAVDLQLQVVQAAPDLTGNDSDNDGTTDTEEGFGDSDNDGIPDYLDSRQLRSYELQQQATQFDRLSIRTRPGLSLSLGDTALASERLSPLVNTQDIGRVGKGEGQPGANAADSYVNSGGYYDFTVRGLTVNSLSSPLAASLLSIPVVIPQAAPIPKGAVYREYTDLRGWHNFALDEKNQYFSAPDSSGFCPPPGDVTYVQGLNEGHTCVELLIEDNGPNDDPSSGNFVIKNLGGVTVSPDANNNPGGRGACGGLFCSGSGGGGGAVGGGLMAVLLMYGWVRLSRRRGRGWQ